MKAPGAETCRSLYLSLIVFKCICWLNNEKILLLLLLLLLFTAIGFSPGGSSHMVGLFCKRVLCTWNQFNITLKFNTFLHAVSFMDSGNCKLSLKNPVKLELK
jgi:hypothetical protein